MSLFDDTLSRSNCLVKDELRGSKTIFIWRENFSSDLSSAGRQRH